MRRREPASLELAANDANPDNAERGRHGAHPCVHASAFVKPWRPPRARNRLGSGGFGSLKGAILSRQRSSDDDPAGEGDRARPRAITILGAPVEAGASVPGAAMGPAMLRTAGIAKPLSDLGHDVEDRGDLAPPAPLNQAAAPEGKAHRFADVAAWARLLARETYAVLRAGRTPIVLGGDHSHRDGFDRRRRPLRGRGGARAVRPVARRPFGFQHAIDLALRQYARHVARDVVPGARARGRVRRRAARVRRSQPAAPVRHPLDRLGRTAAVARPRRRCCRHADGWTKTASRSRSAASSIGFAPATAFCMSVWTSTSSIRRLRQALAPPFRAGRPTARRTLSWSCCTNPVFRPRSISSNSILFSMSGAKARFLLVDLTASLFGRQVYPVSRVTTQVGGG